MNYLRGFLMAWGNFSAIPCPCKKWHQQARRQMLCTMPLVGICIGILTAALWRLLCLVGAPDILTGALTTAFYFCATGFIHLDGFMDCSDALLSARPLEEKQRILKDPNVGAFAAVALILMMLVFAASMTALTAAWSAAGAMTMIQVLAISRSMAAAFVCQYPAMGSSQYADLAEPQEGRQELPTRQKQMSGLDVAVLMIAAILPMAVATLPPLMIHTAGGLIFFFAPAFVTMVTAVLAGRYDRKQLGGMSGDIAGHMIVCGELAGILTAGLLTPLLG